jgi:hypothetical protein
VDTEAIRVPTAMDSAWLTGVDWLHVLSGSAIGRSH